MKTQHMWKLTISNYISILETIHNHVYNHNKEWALTPPPKKKSHLKIQSKNSVIMSVWDSFLQVFFFFISYIMLPQLNLICLSLDENLSVAPMHYRIEFKFHRMAVIDQWWWQNRCHFSHREVRASMYSPPWIWAGFLTALTHWDGRRDAFPVYRSRPKEIDSFCFLPLETPTLGSSTAEV